MTEGREVIQDQQRPTFRREQIGRPRKRKIANMAGGTALPWERLLEYLGKESNLIQVSSILTLSTQ